jgi:L-lactate utilization protein LutB
MSDDSESKQLAIILNAAGKISDTTLVNDLGFDALEEAEVIRKNKYEALDDLVKEQEKQAEAQGRAQLIMAKYQAEAQLIMNKIPLKHKIDLFATELSQENGQTNESLEY